MWRMTALAALAAAGMILTLHIGGAWADYYKYTDKSGAVCITNSLDSVPAKYRGSVKVIRDETLERKDTKSRPVEGKAESAQVPSQEQSTPPPEQPTTFIGKIAARFPWAKPAAALAVVILGFFLVRRLSYLLPSAALARIVMVAFFLGVFVLGFKLYTDYLSDSYFSIKKKVLAMFEKSNRRETPDNQEVRPSPDPLKDGTSQ